MSDSQTQQFVIGEADRYFERNRRAVFDRAGDPATRLLALAELSPRRVLELGAGTGDRVGALAEATGCSAVAVEPSGEAVAEGRRRYPQVEFVVGTLHEPNVDGDFDVVILNFVLHWVGRPELMASVSAVDRLVADGGHLVIGDFAPAGFARTNYRHQPGLWTYKQDYTQIFRASGLYDVVAELVGEYAGRVPVGGAPPAGRARYTLLHKSLEGHYQEVTLD